MKKLKHPLILATLLFLVQALPAQQIRGIVKDGNTHHPLAAVTVTLHGLTDTLFSSSTISTESGEFAFDKIAAGTYTIQASHAGYNHAFSNSIAIAPDLVPEIISIALTPVSKELQGLTVKSSKPFISFEADKVVLNVEASPVAAGSTAWDVLMKAPGLVESEGSLQFRSKSVNVLINGRPSNLTNEDLKNMLAGMPANGIEKIELISNPSAKYDAQNAAVINIRLVKNKNLGTNGTLTGGIGSGRHIRYNGGIALNHRSARVNIYGSYDFLHNSQFYDTRSIRQLDPGTAVRENEHETRYRNNNSYRIGLDYEISKKRSLGVMLKGFVNSRERKTINIATLDHATAEDSFFQATTVGHARFNSPAINAYYRSVLDSAGSEFTINADYFRYHKDWGNDFITRYYDHALSEYRQPFMLRDDSPASITVRSASVDYVRPYAWLKLEAGLKTTFTTTDNNVLWRVNESGAWETDLGKTNHFVYHENINAAYVILSKSIRKFDIKAGLRAEQTNSEGESKTLNQSTDRDYFGLFPNLAVSFNQSDNHQFGFSYRKSIRRFGFDIVNPFIIYNSQYNYYQGNENIKPSQSHNLEISHSFKNKLISSLSYSHISDALAEVYKQAPNSDAAIRTYENLRSADQVTLDMSYMEMLFGGKWISSNSIGAVYAKYNDPGSLQAGNATRSAYFASNNLFKLKNGWNAELSGNVFTPIALGVYKFHSRGTVDAGVSKTILQKAGKLTLNVSDIFNTLRSEYDVISYGISSNYHVKAESRYVRLTFSYKFGNKNVKASKNRKTGIEDEKGRTESN